MGIHGGKGNSLPNDKIVHFSKLKAFANGKINVTKKLTLSQTSPFLTCLQYRAFNPLPDDKILDRSNLKQSADDNFKFDENRRKFSKWVQNTVGKGEIVRYEQFLLFPVFSKGLFPRGVKRCHCVGMG